MPATPPSQASSSSPQPLPGTSALPDQGATRSTCWSVIVRAQGAGPEAHAALAQLIARYDGTLMAFFRGCRRPWNLSPEDLKQDFLAGLLHRGDIRKADRCLGRFRSWLYAAARNFMRNVWTASLAQRRDLRRTVRAPIECARDRDADEGDAWLEQLEPAPNRLQAMHSPSAEESLMRRFAEDTLLHALTRHRAEARDPAQIERLLRFLPGPQLDLDALAPIAASFGIPPNRLAVQICELRARHARILREVVADTLDVDPSTPDGARALELELGELYRLLSEVPARPASEERS